MRLWPRLLLTVALLAQAPAFAQSAHPVEDKKAEIEQLRQRAAALKAALAGDVCADPAAAQALLSVGLTPTANDLAKTPQSPPPEQKGDIAPLSRQALVERLQKAVVLVIAESDTGSGFFVSPDIVVTNHHVVASAKDGQVMVLGRGLDAPRPAQIVAHTNGKGQNSQDYAILRVNGAHAATPLPLVLDAGELSNVVAAGFPGLLLDTDMNFRALIRGDMKAMPELAMSQGTIMAVQNRDRGIPVIAHSAQISGGNSGGPLVDMCGQVMGINTFINVAVKQGTSAGFALAAKDLNSYLRTNGVTPIISTGTCLQK